MTEAIEAAKRILAANSPESFEVLYGGDHHYGDDCDLVATELLRLAEPEWGEPKEPGEYYVDCIDRVAYVYREDTDGQPWAIEYIKTDPGTLASVIHWEPLNGRRVAPCIGRPRKAVA